MQQEELLELLQEIQTLQCETNTLEVKRASHGNPKKLYDTLSSFSNQDSGGTIVFGLDEKNHFEEVGVYDSNSLMRAVSDQGMQMTPVVRPVLTSAVKDNKHFVAAEIPAVEYSQRPCFYTGVGRIRGSYIRSGDQDLPMTEYEIFAYEAFRKQIYYDSEGIEETGPNDLNPEQLAELLRKCENNKAHFSNLPYDEKLARIGVLKDGNCSMAAILTVGKYPQGHFPQLCILASSVPGTQVGDVDENGHRFLDSERISGTLPEMLENALQFLARNLSRRIQFDGTGHRSSPLEIPEDALREAVLNALLHRDYGPYARDKAIQVQIFTDRVEINSPGGLYGVSDISRFRYETPSTRNRFIVLWMELLGQTENRYSGIPTMYRLIQRAGLKEPLLENRRDSFCVTFFRQPKEESLLTVHANLLKKNEALLDYLKTQRSRKEIADFLGYKTPSQAIKTVVQPLIDANVVLLTHPNDSRSRKQRFYTNPEVSSALDEL